MRNNARQLLSVGCLALHCWLDKIVEHLRLTRELWKDPFLGWIRMALKEFYGMNDGWSRIEPLTGVRNKVCFKRQERLSVSYRADQIRGNDTHQHIHERLEAGAALTVCTIKSVN